MEKKYKYYIDAWFAGVAMKEELEKSGSKRLWLYSNLPSREVVLQEGAKEDSFMFDKGYKIVGVFKYERIG